MKIDVRKYAVYDEKYRRLLKGLTSDITRLVANFGLRRTDPIGDLNQFTDRFVIKERRLPTGPELAELWPKTDTARDLIVREVFKNANENSERVRQFVCFNQMKCFDERGRNVVHYSHEMIEMFQNTVIDDQVALANLHLPYDAFYISAPYGGMEGAIVSRSSPWLRILTLFYSPGNPHLVSRYSLFREDAKDFVLESTEEFDYRKHLMLILNCLIYISNYKEDAILMRPPNTPESLLKKLAREKKAANVQKTQDTLIKLGFQKVLYCGYGEEFEKQYELNPHWRRGHWRSQPCGPERAERKTIWIKPVLVRRDKGLPKHGHVYQVDRDTALLEAASQGSEDK